MDTICRRIFQQKSDLIQAFPRNTVKYVLNFSDS